MHNTGVSQILAGRFRVESLLGSGGMGAVYAATDTSIGRRVAIKMLHPDVALQRDSLERMREEAVSLASLHHPNIVQLFDFYAGGPDSTFLVMELVEAPTLAAVLRTRVPFPVDAAIDYVQQVLSALAAAHALGIFHRDIKPGNLLVVPLPARHELIKIIDFGIAKLTEETIRRRPTTAGVLLGTPTYMAPEQTVGGMIDARTDLYAVAVVLYRMLAGGNPFEGGDLATTLTRVATHVPAELSRVRADVPEHVSRAVMRALAKDPSLRFANAIEFAQALTGHGAGQALVVANSGAMVPAHQGPAQQNAPGLDVRTSRTTITAVAPPDFADKPRRRGLALAVALLAAALLVSVGAGAVWLLFVAPTQTPSPTPVGDAASVQNISPPTSAPTASATASAPVASNTAPISRTPPKREVLARGKCACYPLTPVLGHGGNQRLSPRATLPPCSCLTPSGGPLCQHSFVPPPCKRGTPGCDDPCKQRTFIGTPRTVCTGFDSSGAESKGVIGTCQFSHAAIDEYPGPSGQPCKGFTHMQEQIDGVQRCP